MDVHAKLAQVRALVEHARSMPMSASAVVNRTELLALLEELDGEYRSAFEDAQDVLDDREKAVDEGRQEAARIIAAAREEREHMVSDTEVFKVAKRQADELLAKAQTESEGLRKEADDYVDAKLANFEITLERTTEAVKRGRQRLAGRTAFDALSDDDVGAIKLPEHLEG